jgi:hypothetical protein
VVELDHVRRERQRPEQRIGVRGVALGDQQRADLRSLDRLTHPAATDLGEQLGAQADRQRREVGVQRPPQQAAHAAELGAGRLVVHGRLRAAEDDHAVEPVETLGQDVAGAQVPLVEVQTGRAEPFAQPAGRIGLVDDDDEQTGHAVEVSRRTSSPPAPRRLGTGPCDEAVPSCSTGPGGSGAARRASRSAGRS